MLARLSLVLLGVAIGAGAMFAGTYTETIRWMLYRDDSARVASAWRKTCEAQKDRLLAQLSDDAPEILRSNRHLVAWTAADVWNYRPSSSRQPIGAFETAQICNRAHVIPLGDIVAAIEKRGIALAERREKAIWRDVQTILARPPQ